MPVLGRRRSVVKITDVTAAAAGTPSEAFPHSVLPYPPSIPNPTHVQPSPGSPSHATSLGIARASGGRQGSDGDGRGSHVESRARSLSSNTITLGCQRCSLWPCRSCRLKPERPSGAFPGCFGDHAALKEEMLEEMVAEEEVKDLINKGFYRRPGDRQISEQVRLCHFLTPCSFWW
ncbi:uncharacterized protein [Elaeis guineensis]|uniref:uncharacterized protein isoform X1 n=1 Tax=Elaeis guineensis var. tenera TaxID=51953 RepID=UPI003C6D18A8